MLRAPANSSLKKIIGRNRTLEFESAARAPKRCYGDDHGFERLSPASHELIDRYWFAYSMILALLRVVRISSGVSAWVTRSNIR